MFLMASRYAFFCQVSGVAPQVLYFDVEPWGTQAQEVDEVRAFIGLLCLLNDSKEPVRSLRFRKLFLPTNLCSAMWLQASGKFVGTKYVS